MKQLPQLIPLTRPARWLGAGLLVATVLFAAGCVTHGHVRVRGEAHVSAPALVEIRPGLWVVEDYHRPVFYSDGYYWLYDDGLWYRSTVHHGSWSHVRVRTVPVVVRRIDRPRTYVRYRASDRKRVRRGPPPRRANERVPVRRSHPPARKRVRDHRSDPPSRHKQHKKSPPPRSDKPDVKVRDHRSRKDSSHESESKPRVRDHRKRDSRVRDHRRPD